MIVEVEGPDLLRVADHELAGTDDRLVPLPRVVVGRRATTGRTAARRTALGTARRAALGTAWRTARRRCERGRRVVDDPAPGPVPGQTQAEPVLRRGLRADRRRVGHRVVGEQPGAAGRDRRTDRRAITSR